MVLALLACAFGALSAESFFSTGISPEKDQIFKNESAVFLLEVYSSSNRIETFTVYTDIEWTIATDPAEDKYLKIYPQSKKQTRILIKPKAEARIFPGAYEVRIYLKNRASGEIITNNVIIHVKGEGEADQDYLPSVRAEVKISDRVDPREEIVIKVLLENQNPLNIEFIELYLTSDLFSIQDTVALGGLEKKEIVYTTKLDDIQPPVSDTLKVNLKTVNEEERVFEFNSVPVRFSVIEYGGIEERKETRKEFLVRHYDYILYNSGNVGKKHTLKIKRNIIRAIFNSFDKEPLVKKEDGRKYYIWEAEIPVRGSFTVTETLNFRPYGIALAIIAVLAGLYAVFRSPLIIRKSMVVTSAKHGGIAGLNVQIDLKNRSSRNLSNLVIKDRVPNMFEVVKDFEVGTLAPAQILKHEKKGTIIRWNIDDIEAFEERIITYRIVSKLNIIGRFVLPPASLMFQDAKRKLRIHSNKVMMSHSSRVDE